MADSLFDHLGTAGFLGTFGLFVECFGAGGGLRFPGMYSKIVRSLSYIALRCAKAWPCSSGTHVPDGSVSVVSVVAVAR